MIKNMYSAGALRAGYMALERVGYNKELAAGLLGKPEAIPPSVPHTGGVLMGKRSNDETGGPKGKRRRTNGGYGRR